MPKSLADGHSKIAILTTKPANIFNPTAGELNGGIQAACRILASDWNFSATDSDKVAEKAKCDVNNVNALGPSNFTTAMTIFRFFNAGTGLPDAVEDALFTACKVKGTTLWIYERENGLLETVAWASGQDIHLGGEVLTDEVQNPQNAGGYVKRRIPMEPQSMRTNLVVA